MELSPQRADDYRAQVTPDTWRYAAQGPLAGKVKPHVLRLGRRDARRERHGAGGRFKPLLLLVVFLTVGASVAWHLHRAELDGVREHRSSLVPGARAPLDAPGAVPGDNADLPPPIVPSELGSSPWQGEVPARPAPEGAAPEGAAPEGAAPEVPEPWAAVLAATGEPPPFEAVCFDDSPLEQRAFKLAEARRWLAAIVGQGLRENSDPRQGTMMEGLSKLRAPWPAGTALRLSLTPAQGFRVRISAGEAAVTLDYTQQPRPAWAAYAASGKLRVPSDGTRNVPATLALIGSDNDRYARTGGGPITLHYHDGQLVMTRGDVQLLSAPLPAQPSEVHFEGSAVWRGIALVRCGPPPLEDEPRPVVLRSDKPARLPWRFNPLRGARLQKSDDGPVRLVAQRTASDALATFRVTEPGLHEIVMQVAEAQPGTGIFLGDKDGKPIHRLGFLRERPGGRLTAEYSPPGERREAADYATHAQPPLVRGGQWFRLVLGLGTFKAWTSADGRHWARLQSPPRGTPLGYGTIGIYCLPGEAERAISLTHLEIRELSALTSLASADARERAVTLEHVSDMASWLQAVAERQPSGGDAKDGKAKDGKAKDIASDDWRRACALRTLAGSPPRELAVALLEGLVREAIAQGDPVAAVLAAGDGNHEARPGLDTSGLRLDARRGAAADSRLAVLEEAGLLSDTWDSAGAARLLACYDRLGEAFVREGRPGRSALLASALAGSEIWTAETSRPGDILRGPCAKSELLERVEGGHWAAVQELTAQLDYWRWPGDATQRSLWQPRELTPWIEWGGYLASRMGGVKTAPPRGEDGAVPRGPRIGRRPRPISEDERREIERRNASRHPLIEEISKDGFNLIAEFEASLAGEAYEDACQTAMTADPQAALGLLPWAKDSQLSLTFPTAVAVAMQTHPGLRETMLERFAAPGVVRLRQAKLAGDVAAVRATTVHLVGTQAAAEAHQFLGDQALAAGDFDTASRHYAVALRDAPADARRLIGAMLRLAGAMAGRDVGQKPSEPIDFGGTRLSSDEFEQLVRDHLSRRGQGGGGGVIAAFEGRAALSIPPSTRFDLRPFFDWQMRGRDPHSPAAIDATARQFAVAFDAATMYVQERDQIRALNLAGGKERWASLRDGGFHPQWCGVAFRPCLAGGRVYLRQSEQDGGKVLCFNAADGSLKWPERRLASRTEDGQLVSDPLVIGEGLYVFTVVDEPDNTPGANSQTLDLRLVVLDAATGQTRRRHSVARLRSRESWGRPPRLVCLAVAAQDQIVATVGGCVLCCDTSGQARWVRKQTLLPHTLPEIAASSLAQPQEPPLVVGDRVYVTQRDVRTVQCLDLGTGRLHWRHVSPDVRRVAGVSGETAAIETADGFVGLNAATGDVLWHRDVEHVLEARLCGAADGAAGELIYARRDAIFGGQSRPSLVWLDLRSGRDVAVLPLPELAGREAVLGPLVVQGNRTWLFSGEHTQDTKRRIWELVPRGPRFAMTNDEEALRFYLPDSPSAADRGLRGDVATAIGWTLLASSGDQRTLWQTKWQNEPDVALTLAMPGRPVRLLRQVAVPGKGPAKLAIQVGHEPGERWELEIAAAGKSLLRCEVSPKTASGGWLRREIDLAALAGQTVWLSATAGALDGKPAHPAWRKMEPPGERGASAL